MYVGTHHGALPMAPKSISKLATLHHLTYLRSPLGQEVFRTAHITSSPESAT